ncbi:hypothetical protein [Streptomyces sp. NPDC090025]|uniref:hypothetical protein n=1 Tax=Streptomyces sp. NPDC090025 TaxID=3365922 RepID=UPI0038339A30
MAVTQSNATLSAYPAPFEIPFGAPRSGVIHVRHRHRTSFTVVGNHLAQFQGMSAVARGIGVFIQSLPDGADITIKQLMREFPEGEITIRRAVNELVAAGYLERRRVALGGGRFATRLIWYDKPGCGGGPQRPAASPAPAPAPQPAPQPAPLEDPEAECGVDPEADPEMWPEDWPETEPETEPEAWPDADTQAAGPDPDAEPVPPPVPDTAPPTPPLPAEPLTGPAVDLLARLRVVDPRLLLSWPDVRALAPEVDRWFARQATPAQVVRTLTAGLPPAHVPIHRPVRFLAHRLATLLPPPLPAEAPRFHPARPPVVSCEGCERGIRTHDPHPLCGDCRTAPRPTTPAATPGSAAPPTAT